MTTTTPDIIQLFLTLLNDHPAITIAHVRHEYSLSIQPEFIEYRRRRPPGPNSGRPYFIYRFDIPTRLFYVNHQPSPMDFNEKFLPILKSTLNDLKTQKSIILTGRQGKC